MLNNGFKKIAPLVTPFKNCVLFTKIGKIHRRLYFIKLNKSVIQKRNRYFSY